MTPEVFTDSGLLLNYKGVCRRWITSNLHIKVSLMCLSKSYCWTLLILCGCKIALGSTPIQHIKGELINVNTSKYYSIPNVWLNKYGTILKYTEDINIVFLKSIVLMTDLIQTNLRYLIILYVLFQHSWSSSTCQVDSLCKLTFTILVGHHQWMSQNVR